MSRLIFVSNRLPYTVRRHGSEFTLTRSSGGLVSGIGPVHEGQDSLWIGNLGGDVEGLRGAELERRRLVPVTLPRDRARRHYEGFSNGVLWPLFHYFLESMEYDPEDFGAYQFVNQRFADVVAERARPGDRIWIHDYHLMLLPSLLRQRLPDARIGFFLHIPFPSSEVFRVLPVAEAILKGLLGSDLIGLHTYDYARHLATSYRRILGKQMDTETIDTEHGRTQVRVFPLGIDMERYSELARSPQVERRLMTWKRRVRGRKVVLGIDRLDYSKGIPIRLQVYRRLLSTRPSWRRDAMFIQLAVPTRSGILNYKKLKQDVERRVGEVNGEFGELGQVPIHYMYRSIPEEELSALYRLADVAVVTPLRDGMNLVAKEYIASRNDNSGVLLLSEFAGAASELGEALVVNTWDIDGSVRALDRALLMRRDEQERRMSALRRRVAGYSAQRWARFFIEALDRCPARATHTSARREADAWKADLVRAFAGALKPLLVLDYDGTLQEFISDPEEARPAEEVLRLLKDLSGLPCTDVAVLSGRDRQSLAHWFGHLPICLVAEHGFVLRNPRSSDWEELLPGVDRSWLPAVEEAMASYVARTPGSFIERKHSGLAWHFRKAEPELGLRQGRELAHHLTEYFANRPVRVLQGACIVEAHAQGISKWATIRALWNRFADHDFVLAAGDDATDEDLFRALPEAGWSIKVGPGRTAARYRLQGPDRLKSLLAVAVDARRTAGKGHRQNAPGGSRRGSAGGEPRTGRGATRNGPLLRDDLRKR
jgi:trehalose 6-phosphate synthase/phosphatase